jgi:hypothetical protein
MNGSSSPLLYAIILEAYFQHSDREKKEELKPCGEATS